MNGAKEFWKSKTFWFNCLAVGVYVAQSFGYTDFKASPELMALVAAVVNIGLRFVTNTSVSIMPVEK